MTREMRDAPQFYLTAPSPCPYLPGMQERKVFTHLVGRRAVGLNDALTQTGFRRSQTIAYRPACENCRTSGEMRLSNYLLWQIAYTEIYVTERLWPDFRGIHLLEAMADYQRRERRYGGLSDNVGQVEENPEPIKSAAN